MRARAALPLIALCLAGCGPRKPPPAPIVTPPQPVKLPPPVKPGKGPAISNQAVGPVHLGMRESDLKGLEGYTATPASQDPKTGRRDLMLSRGNHILMVVGLQGDKVEELRVVDAGFHTPGGARVGLGAPALQKLFGPGQVAPYQQAVCATFAKEPGYRFCFAPGSGPKVKSWAEIVNRHLSVTTIIVGRPGKKPG